jgi:integrase
MTTKVFTRVGKDGKKRYTARYTTPDGRTLSAGTFGDKRTALTAAIAAHEKSGSQQWVDPRSGRVLLKDFVEQVYLPALGSIEVSTARGYRSMLRTHILPVFGDKKMSSIRPSDVAKWVADPFPKRVYDGVHKRHEKTPRTPQMARAAFSLLHVIMDWAVRDEIIVSNPCRGVRLPTKPTPAVVIMTPEEFDLILDNIRSDKYKALLIVAIGTGMRWSEVVGLCPAQIDFPRRRLVVDRSIVVASKEDSGGTSRFVRKAYPKGKRPRTIALDDDVLQTLSVMIALRGLEADSEEEIFQSSRGNPVDNNSFTREVLAPAVKAAGLEGKGYTMKTLRSSYCSWLLAGGADLPVVQALLGHQQITTTQKYVQVLPESYDAALVALRSIRRRSS